MDISLTAVLAQIINFGILFFLFRKFLTRPIISAIEERRALIRKVEQADVAYDTRIKEADQEAKKILQEGLEKKDKIIAEAGVLANKRKEDILSEARQKASDLTSEAKRKAQYLETELKNGFADGVKKTSFVVLKKLFDKDATLKKEYLDEIVKEVVEK